MGYKTEKKIPSIILFVFIVLLILVGTIVPAYAAPTQDMMVTDSGEMLSDREEQEVSEMLYSINRQTGIEYLVYTIKSLNGEDIETCANRLFRTAGLGDKEKDNGLLLLISYDDRKFRLEVGYGLEGDIPDTQAANIINTMTPYFKEGNYGDGVKAAVKQTAVILNSSGEYTISEDWAAQAASNDEANQTSSLIAAGLVLGICYLLLGYTFWLNWPETKENFYNLWKSGKFKPFKEKKRQEILTKEAKEAEEREKERKRQEEEERKLIEREQRRAEKEAKEAEEREKEREHREEKERKPTKRKRHRVEKGARRRKESQKGETNTFDTSSKPSEQEEKKPNATPIIGGATLTYAMLASLETHAPLRTKLYAAVEPVQKLLSELNKIYRIEPNFVSMYCLAAALCEGQAQFALLNNKIVQVYSVKDLYDYLSLDFYYANYASESAKRIAICPCCKRAFRLSQRNKVYCSKACKDKSIRVNNKKDPYYSKYRYLQQYNNRQLNKLRKQMADSPQQTQKLQDAYNTWNEWARSEYERVSNITYHEQQESIEKFGECLKEKWKGLMREAK